MLGWHWLAQADRCDARAVRDPAVLAQLLTTLATALGLTVVAPPVVRPARGGLAGIVLLAESHAAVHVDDATDSALVDVFSCRPLDPVTAEACVREALGARTVQGEVHARGALPAAQAAS